MSSLIRIPRAALLEDLRRSPRQALDDSVQATLRHLQHSARGGRGLLADVLGRQTAFSEWEHYPHGDARDGRSGYRFYYHAHAASQRAAGEHGHFHVFAPRPRAAAGEAGHAHLFALSVDDRGWPMRVFTTNRWVTAEHWENARWILQALRRLDLAQARPRRVADWLQHMACLFAPQIREVVRQRDRRIDQRLLRQPASRVLEDRRTHIVSQCRVDLGWQFRLLQDAGVA